jgi:ABC-type nitrate/sulfonate/bicarbonate transport system substrate-binding protein
VAAATALAERVTAATAPPLPDTKTDNRDRSGLPETLVHGNAEKSGSASANDKDLLVVVLMAHPDMKSVSDLTGKTIAIDDRYSASNGTVRTALVAAGASFVQLSEGQATAINRLVNGEVPAAVLVLVSAEAAEGFPEIPGFRIFRIPLSSRSLKARP